MMLSMISSQHLLFFYSVLFRLMFNPKNKCRLPKQHLEIPEDIQNILDKSCFGCHNVDATSDKAKKKLLIDQMHELSKIKLVAALGDIRETVER